MTVRTGDGAHGRWRAYFNSSWQQACFNEIGGARLR
jgi:hypothetical protein